MRQAAVSAFPKKRVHDEPISLGTLCECTVHDRERVIALDIVDISDSKDRTESLRFDLHRARFWRGAWRRLWERGGHCGVKRDVAFHFLHDLMDVAVQNRDGSESSQKPERLFGVICSPAPLRINRPKRNVCEHYNRRA